MVNLHRNVHPIIFVAQFSAIGIYRDGIQF